jgi:hypothetical protein
MILPLNRWLCLVHIKYATVEDTEIYRNMRKISIRVLSMGETKTIKLKKAAPI